MSTETTQATRVDFLTSIEQRVEHLHEWEGLTPDDALKLLDDIDGIKHRTAIAEESLKKFLVAAMPERGWRELRLGTKHWWVGPKKRPPKCKNVPRALEAIMEKTGGDWEATGSTLSTGAIKYGAAKKILGDTFLDHFEIIETDELLSEGENPNVLQCQDDRFIK